MRRTRRLPALLAGGLAVVLLGGCAEQPEPVTTSASASPSGPTPEELVRAAAGTTDEQGSSRYTLTTTTKVNGVDVVFVGEGVLNWADDRGETTYAVPAGQVNQRLLGPRLYLSLPQQPGVFFELQAQDVAASPVGGTVDPTVQLHMLAAVLEAELVGQKEVREEETTHYKGSYDVVRAIRGTSGPLQHAAILSLLGPARTVPKADYEVFLDEEGRLRRLQQTIEVPASPATGGQKLSVSTTLELYEFGVEVTVKGPPGAQIRDGAPILAALRKAMPPPTAKPSLPASPPASPPVSPAAAPPVSTPAVPVPSPNVGG